MRATQLDDALGNDGGGGGVGDIGGGEKRAQKPNLAEAIGTFRAAFVYLTATERFKRILPLCLMAERDCKKYHERKRLHGWYAVMDRMKGWVFGGWVISGLMVLVLLVLLKVMVGYRWLKEKKKKKKKEKEEEEERLKHLLVNKLRE